MSASVLFDTPGPRTRRRSRIASVIVVLLIAAGLAWVIYTLAQPRDSSGITLPGYFDWSRWDIVVLADFWVRVWGGLRATLLAAAVGAAMALVVGVLFAMLRTSVFAAVRIPTTIVLEFFRGMPVLLMMLFILLVASTGAFWAVVLALGVYNGAIIGESLRAGLAALPRGQREAGLSLGLTRFQTKTFIEFPQAFRQMLPVIIAQFVVLLKDTSLGYIVGYNELIRTTMNNLGSSVGNRYLFTLFLVTLVIYLTVNLSLSAVARRVARRRTPGTIRPKDQITPTASIAVATSFIDNPEDKTTE
jgi:glutamate transport system permease protein